MGLALVTGTSTGIGLATAVALARAGHTVAATMRNLKGAAEIEKIAAAESLPIFVSQLDIDDDASVAQGVAAIVASHGPVDILVNNAGTSRAMAFETVTDEIWQADLEFKLFAAIRMSRLAWQGVKQRRYGRIINVLPTIARRRPPRQRQPRCRARLEWP